MIKLYWRAEPVCIYCVKAKTLLESREIAYESILIGEDISRAEVVRIYPFAKTLPIVVVDGNYIGGYTELQQFITANNIMGENYGNKRDNF